MVRMIFIIGCLLWWSNALAEDYYTEHAVGWHWYDDPAEAKQLKSPKPMTVAPPKSDPTAEIDSVRKTIKQSLDQAILDPTQENVKSYIVLQNQLSSRANQFSNTWQEVLLNHPELNFSINHPTNSMGIKVYQEEESKNKDAAVAAFAKHTGLFFFYRSTCPYCQRFAPIVKHFAESYGITVIPITMDGIPLPEFPDSHADTGQAKKFHVTVEPSLFAVDPYTQKAFPVAYGLTSETELRENIYKIITNFKGDSV